MSVYPKTRNMLADRVTASKGPLATSFHGIRASDILLLCQVDGHGQNFSFHSISTTLNIQIQITYSGHAEKRRREADCSDTFHVNATGGRRRCDGH